MYGCMFKMKKRTHLVTCSTSGTDGNGDITRAGFVYHSWNYAIFSSALPVKSSFSFSFCTPDSLKSPPELNWPYFRNNNFSLRIIFEPSPELSLWPVTVYKKGRLNSNQVIPFLKLYHDSACHFVTMDIHAVSLLWQFTLAYEQLNFICIIPHITYVHLLFLIQ